MAKFILFLFVSLLLIFFGVLMGGWIGAALVVVCTWFGRAEQRFGVPSFVDMIRERR